MRKAIHTRDIQSQVWLLDDELWEIEIRLLDTKGYDTRVGLDRELPAGDALHEMRIRLEVGFDQVIRKIDVAMPYTPFEICPGVMRNFDSLVGESMARGWNALLSERFSGAGGCRHLVDMLRSAATVLFQAMSYQHEFTPEQIPYWTDSCHAFRKDGEVIRELKRRFPGQNGEEQAEAV